MRAWDAGSQSAAARVVTDAELALHDVMPSDDCLPAHTTIAAEEKESAADPCTDTHTVNGQEECFLA